MRFSAPFDRTGDGASLPIDHRVTHTTQRPTLNYITEVFSRIYTHSSSYTGHSTQTYVVRTCTSSTIINERNYGQSIGIGFTCEMNERARKLTPVLFPPAWQHLLKANINVYEYSIPIILVSRTSIQLGKNVYYLV